MSEWLDIGAAPRDGTWILLEGEINGGDTTSVTIGRYEPMTTDTGTYEWRIPSKDCRFVHEAVDTIAPVDAWDWLPEGR